MRSEYRLIPDYATWPTSFHQCLKCRAIVHDSSLTEHTNWHEALESQSAAPTPTGPVVPNFRHNTVWLDYSGHPWLAQLDPNCEDTDVILLVSSLGSCTVAEAMKYYGPAFTQVGGVLA